MQKSIEKLSKNVCKKSSNEQGQKLFNNRSKELARRVCEKISENVMKRYAKKQQGTRQESMLEK